MGKLVVHWTKADRGDMWVQGEVQILGQTRKGLLADDPELAERLKVGMVFQNGALFDSLTVGENVGFMLYEHTSLPHERVQVSCGNVIYRTMRPCVMLNFPFLFTCPQHWLSKVLEAHLLMLCGLQPILVMPTHSVMHNL